MTEIPVHHRQRRYGHSKYGVRRFMRGFLDLITIKFLTGYGQRPQHALGAAGLLFFLLGLVGLGYLGALWLLTHIWDVDFGPIGNRPLLAYSIASMLLGVQAISLGLLAELIVAYSGHDRDSYSVAERTARRSTDHDAAVL